MVEKIPRGLPEKEKEGVEKGFMQKLREKAGRYGKAAMLIMALELFAQKTLAEEKKEEKKKIEFVKEVDKEAKTKEGFKVIYIAGKIGDNEAVALSVEDPGDPNVKGDEIICQGKFIKSKQENKEIIQGESECNLKFFKNPLGETAYTPEIQRGESPIGIIELAKQTMQARRNQLYADCMVLKGFRAVMEDKSAFGQWLDKVVKERKDQIQKDFGETAIDDNAFEEFIK
jgi:hypothetical protein